jgi:hypothetical protein
MDDSSLDNSLDSGIDNPVTTVSWAISVVLVVVGFIGLMVGAYGMGGTLCMLGSVAFFVGFGFMIYNRRSTTSS